MKLRFSLLIMFCFMLAQTSAHEIKSGYLEITETTTAVYSVQWKSPMRSGRPLPVLPRFPRNCVTESESSRITETAGFLSYIQVNCQAQLQEHTLFLKGLDATLSDVIIRFNPLNKKSQTLRATPQSPEIMFKFAPSRLQISKTYFYLGVEHILLGLDHLLFVFGLILLITGFKRLLISVTAFTVAHSITLIASSLNWISIPINPVEAVIALSILFLANEIAFKNQNQHKERLTQQQSWSVVFIFGLLHGFGFAGALSSIGLPEDEIPIALLSFNLGVEVGQVSFVCMVVLLLQLISKTELRLISEKIASYVVGITASVWLFERIFQTV